MNKAWDQTLMLILISIHSQKLTCVIKCWPTLCRKTINNDRKYIGLASHQKQFRVYKYLSEFRVNYTNPVIVTNVFGNRKNKQTNKKTAHTVCIIQFKIKNKEIKLSGGHIYFVNSSNTRNMTIYVSCIKTYCKQLKRSEKQ